MKKVIVAGGRDFDDRQLMGETLRSLGYDDPNAVEIVSGGADGADRLAMLFSRQILGKKATVFRVTSADWRRLGRKAGPLRNGKMAAYGDELVAFWDGKSDGTRDMIRQAGQAGLVTHTIKY